MSFGWSIGDLIAATTLTVQLAQTLTAQQVQEDADSVIILSFRALQAQRIKELQQELLDLSVKKVQHFDRLLIPGKAEVTSGDEPDEIRIRKVRDFNEAIDAKLGRYGLFHLDFDLVLPLIAFLSKLTPFVTTKRCQRSQLPLSFTHKAPSRNL